ncbi:MAG TPA: DUF488 family protein [Candidatus Limnocylindria bacterium]|nr:DUF488 family protein [Candidatus Limnocylindria bacterium]
MSKIIGIHGSDRGIRLKRIYDEPAASDGFRILVERLWPRGLRKEDAAIDLWLKEIAPSTELRRWYGHDVARWPEFRRRYEAELRANGDAVHAFEECAAHHRTMTFLYAAHDNEHNSAVVLRDFVQRLMTSTANETRRERHPSRRPARRPHDRR